MPAAKTLYLANPYGFSAQQNAGPLQALVAALEALGAEVWEPFARNNQIDKAAAGWAWQIGQADLRRRARRRRDLRRGERLPAGRRRDGGARHGDRVGEAGVPVSATIFRRCTDSEAYPLNLMIFTGLPEAGWEDYWYASVDEIADPDKALARWLRGRGAPG